MTQRAKPADRPIPVRRVIPATNTGACMCGGLGGVHNHGQPGCRNGG